MAPETLFKLINELIAALAQLLWPIVVLVLVLVFRGDITALLARLRKGKVLGQELELDPAIERFRVSVEQAERELPPASESTVSEAITERTASDVDKILRIAATQPHIALIQLSALLEREVRTLLGSLGHMKAGMSMSLPQAIEFLSEQGQLPKHTSGSLQIFWDLRNKIIHGGAQPSESEVISVLDIGLALLKAIRAIPHEINVVYHPSVDVFSDPGCNQLIPDAVGLILETTSPGGGIVTKRIFPTSRKEYYQRGKRVTWEWNMSRVWKSAWYRNPDTHDIQQAWGGAAEFIGRHVEEI